MDAARTAKRLGGNVTIIYRRTKAEMPARKEELHHALEEGINLKVLRGPIEFIGDEKTNFISHTVLAVNELGPADKSGRRSPKPTGETERVPVDLIIMALGNTAEPDRQGRRARAEGLQVGHDRARRQVASRPRSRTSTRAATRRGAARPPSWRRETARRRRAEIGATSVHARRRSRSGWPRRRDTAELGQATRPSWRRLARRRHRGVKVRARWWRARPRPDSSSACWAGRMAS